MRLLLVKENLEAEKLIPPAAPDGSGIGANYVDAYIKPWNATMENGTKVICRRQGLKITLTVGDKVGDAIIRRVDHGPDVRDMLQAALNAAAARAGAKIVLDNGNIYLET